MKKLFAIALSWLALSCAGSVYAQTPNGGGAMVPNTPPVLLCSGTGCVFSPAGPYTFNGPDGSPQFATGSTNTATEYFQAVGGVTSAGATLLARNAAQTGNVSGNITAQNNGNIVYGNNGHGTMATLTDPGAAVTGPFTLTPGISTSPASIAATNGVYDVKGIPGTISSQYIQWTGLTGSANRWQIACNGVLPSTSGQTLFLQISEAGAFKTSGYSVIGYTMAVAAGAFPTPTTASAQAQIQVAGAQTTTAGYSLSFIIDIYNPYNATMFKQFVSKGAGGSPGPVNYMFDLTGFYTSDTNAIDGVRLFFGSGNATLPAGSSCNLKQML